MSSLLHLTPILHIVLENPLLAKTYPAEGYVAGVIDTGYEGFVAVPKDIFTRLALDQLQQERRTLMLANGVPLASRGAYATLRIPELNLKIDGFIETYPGLDEILIGTEALASTRILLDYCTKRIRVERCI